MIGNYLQKKAKHQSK